MAEVAFLWWKEIQNTSEPWGPAPALGGWSKGATRATDYETPLLWHGHFLAQEKTSQYTPECLPQLCSIRTPLTLPLSLFRSSNLGGGGLTVWHFMSCIISETYIQIKVPFTTSSSCVGLSLRSSFREELGALSWGSRQRNQVSVHNM